MRLRSKSTFAPFSHGSTSGSARAPHCGAGRDRLFNDAGHSRTGCETMTAPLWRDPEPNHQTSFPARLLSSVRRESRDSQEVPRGERMSTNADKRERPLMAEANEAIDRLHRSFDLGRLRLLLRVRAHLLQGASHARPGRVCESARRVAPTDRRGTRRPPERCRYGAARTPRASSSSPGNARKPGVPSQSATAVLRLTHSPATSLTPRSAVQILGTACWRRSG